MDKTVCWCRQRILLRLARNIEQLINNPNLRKEMGRRGREMVEREFSSEIVVAQTLDLYCSLLNPQDIAAATIACVP